MIKQICTLIFKSTGWKFKNPIPDDLRSFVFIGAPHTSNYDFIPAMAVSYLLKRNARFVIKKEWLRFPLNLFFGPIGALGLDREALKGSRNGSNTDVMAGLFKQQDELVLMIAPEGTRSPNKKWKTGFYYIAQKAGVPIVCGFADYANKEAGVGLIVHPQNFENDMHTITEFYRGMKGAKPEKFFLDERFDQQQKRL
jgi:1-acyl-sn-glycerol-3-phosphate acyltransferase